MQALQLSSFHSVSCTFLYALHCWKTFKHFLFQTKTFILHWHWSHVCLAIFTLVEALSSVHDFNWLLAVLSNSFEPLSALLVDKQKLIALTFQAIVFIVVCSFGQRSPFTTIFACWNLQASQSIIDGVISIITQSATFSTAIFFALCYCFDSLALFFHEEQKLSVFTLITVAIFLRVNITIYYVCCKWFALVVFQVKFILTNFANIYFVWSLVINVTVLNFSSVA